MSDRVEVDPDEGVVKATRKIRRSGGSVVISIPPQVLDAAGFDVDEHVIIEGDMEDGGITIRQLDE